MAGAKPAPAASSRAIVATPASGPQPAAQKPMAVTVVHPAKVPTVANVPSSGPPQVTTAIPNPGETLAPVVPVKATLKMDVEDLPAPLSGSKGKPSLAHLEAAVRIACAGMVQKVEIVDLGGISLVRVTANDVASERKALEALVLLPEIHHPEVKLEVKLSR